MHIRVFPFLLASQGQKMHLKVSRLGEVINRNRLMEMSTMWGWRTVLLQGLLSGWATLRQGKCCACCSEVMLAAFQPVWNTRVLKVACLSCRSALASLQALAVEKLKKAVGTVKIGWPLLFPPLREICVYCRSAMRCILHLSWAVHYISLHRSEHQGQRRACAKCAEPCGYPFLFNSWN